MEMSRVTTSGRMTIPHHIREKFRLEKGTKVAFIEWDGKLMIQRLDREYFLGLAGILGTEGKMLKSLMAHKRRERKS